MQQYRLAVYRLPESFIKGLFAATLFLLFIAQGCSFNPPLQQKGEAAVQGVWQQDTINVNKGLINYSLYTLTFDCDSFFVKLRSFSKVNYGADTCMRNGKWVEYAKGTYVLNHDTLALKGAFCNADHSIKKDGGCFRFGTYEEQFKIKKTKDSVYRYLNLSSTIPFDVNLIKNITCIPKPL